MLLERNWGMSPLKMSLMLGSESDINGLQPLEMTMDILLPSGETTEVEFEYFKIEKHYFTCFSLFHEEKDCPPPGLGTLSFLRTESWASLNELYFIELKLRSNVMMIDAVTVG
ncbi:hypothetical protein Bca4012_097920 [Brassica carinata]|uniref:Zinc knuckle CX2CX4HX4C domain-containing protein n=1 Tax=Brassica carinata TaxID=52824 RepID=A0A8X7TQT0_BRACI|nr:hypothetical protein Bca52824_080620 [Brassica carinata]